MGCDIHVNGEKRDGDKWVAVELPMRDTHGGYKEKPFGSRQYSKFGFMADVRNYSSVAPIDQPRGVPDDASVETKADYEGWISDAHSASWLSVAEMEDYDYDQQTEDRRYTRQEGQNHFNGGATCEPGNGKAISLREFLDGTDYFESLASIKAAGIERVVFWFDN